MPACSSHVNWPVRQVRNLQSTPARRGALRGALRGLQVFSLKQVQIVCENRVDCGFESARSVRLSSAAYSSRKSRQLAQREEAARLAECSR